MEIIATLACIIISIAMGVDSAVAQQMYKNKSSKITREANAIATTLTKDANLVNQLLQAETDNNGKLLQSLIMSSPAGARVQQMREQLNKSNNRIQGLRSKERDYQNKLAENTANMNQKLTDATTSGSAIVDLIAGAMGTKPPTKEALDQVKSMRNVASSINKNNIDMLTKGGIR